MNLLDENFPEDQQPLLRAWHIPFRQIGRGVSRLGIKDSEIISLLHRHRRVTFFTLDEDFFQAPLCHPGYGLVFLDVRADDAAHFLRRFLRHPRLRTQAARLGIVARVHSDGIQFWQRDRSGLGRLQWC